MIRVLTAEESLRNVTVMAAGGGLIKEHERSRILNSWRRDCMMNIEMRKNTLDTLLAPGIMLVEV